MASCLLSIKVITADFNGVVHRNDLVVLHIDLCFTHVISKCWFDSDRRLSVFNAIIEVGGDGTYLRTEV